MTKNVAIKEESINQVKAYIIGKGYTIGEFYALAASLIITDAPRIKISNKLISAQDLTAEKAIGKSYKPSKQ